LLSEQQDNNDEMGKNIFLNSNLLASYYPLTGKQPIAACMQTSGWPANSLGKLDEARFG
jgi:hypothetical protein